MISVLLAAALLSQEPAEPQTLVPEVSAIALELFDGVPERLDAWPEDPGDASLALQTFAMVGREDLIERIVPGAFSYQPCPVLEGDPVAQVIEQAQSAQIVIVNEAHNQPLHRWTIQVIGEALRPQFEVFAAETFNYLRLEDARDQAALGYYDREPIFARQVTALEAAGYRLAAYEIRAHQRDPAARSRLERIAIREEAQADNLISEVLTENPDARILVHVGYSHVLEAPVTRPDSDEVLNWFAARLKDKTGIDPLTVSQTHCAPALAEGEAATPDPGGDRTPGALTQAPLTPRLVDGSANTPPGAVDLFIAFDAISFTDNRPDWRRQIGDIPVRIPAALLPVEAPVIIEARAPGTPLSALPMDRLLLYPGEQAPMLVPAGEWVLTAWTREGAWSEPVGVVAR